MTTPVPPPDAALPAAVLPAQPTCAADAGSWCAAFYQWTNSDFLARSADTIVSTTFNVSLIVLLCVAARYLIHRAIHRVVEGAANTRVPRIIGRASRPRPEVNGAAATPRRAQRARTMGSVLRSISSTVILVVGAVMVLAEFGVALAPILASAGIVGVAVGFGAQNLVRDFLSGHVHAARGPVRRRRHRRRRRGQRRRGGGRAADHHAAGRTRAPSGTSATARSCASATRARATPSPSSTCRWPTPPTSPERARSSSASSTSASRRRT